MITPKKITPYTCEAFDPQGKSLGFLNDFEFNDLRIQIGKEKASGYYMKMKDGTVCNINHDGRVENWPSGFYDLYEIQLSDLLRIRP